MSLILAHPHHESEITLNYQLGAALVIVGLCLAFVIYSARVVRKNDKERSTSNVLRGIIAASSTHVDTRMAGWEVIRHSLSKASTRRAIAADGDLNRALRSTIRTASPDNGTERDAIDAIESLLGAVQASAR
ncbi:hypothetical protein [uncultured Corynebacterium sp.]|uniref:hypothetical protein n=1 Tax=uncultured Corynebacterium sp. TaxID=159447 RepID=UPI002595DC10|nr:hypothetical protein [uncultured Corynebacterium sp.]